MATMDKITALLKAHYERNDESFNTLSLQIAASEAKSGHRVVADEIRRLVEKYRRPSATQLSFIHADTAFGEMIQRLDERYSMHDLVVSNDVQKRVDRVILEYRERNRLQRNGLQNRNKILLGGASGTGKTMSASVIATETDLPLYVIRLDKIITKYMGATSAKLGQVFEAIEQFEGVYLFDEFDAIGADRMRENDVGEMRRILTSFLMFMERVDAQSIIVAATNQLEVLDKALFRRFDDVIRYNLPTESQVAKLLTIHLGDRIKPSGILPIAQLLKDCSHATVCAVCKDAIKESILTNKPVTKSMLQRLIAEKHDYTMVV